MLADKKRQKECFYTQNKFECMRKVDCKWCYQNRQLS